MTEACHVSNLKQACHVSNLKQAPAGEACRYHWLVGDQVYLTQLVFVVMYSLKSIDPASWEFVECFKF